MSSSNRAKYATVRLAKNVNFIIPAYSNCTFPNLDVKEINKRTGRNRDYGVSELTNPLALLTNASDIIDTTGEPRAKKAKSSATIAPASGATEDEDLPLSVRFNTYSAAQIMLQLMAFNPSPPGVSPPLPTDVDMEDSVEWITTPGFEMANDQTGLSFSTVGYNSDMFFLLDISSNAVRSFAHTSAPLNTIYIPNKKAKMSSICAAKDCLFVLCENPSCLFIVDTKGDWDYFRLADRGITNPKAFACSPDAKFFSVYCADSRSIFRFDTVTCKLLDKICVAKYNLHIKHLRIDHNGNYAVKDSDSWAFVIFDRLSGECTDSFNIHYQSEGNINYPYHFRDCAFLPDGKIVLCYEEINALAITSCEHKGRIISFLGEGRTYNSVSCNSEGTLLAASECSNSYLSFRNAHKLPANPSCDIAPLILF